MQVNFKEISKSDFNKLESTVLFKDRLTESTFGVISNGVNSYKFGWQSTVIKPKLLSIDGLRYSVGIDLVFVIFEFATGEVVINLDLDWFFYDTKLHKGFVYVITELEIIEINVWNFKINTRYPLTDFFESMEFLEEHIVVKSVDGNTINI